MKIWFPTLLFLLFSIPAQAEFPQPGDWTYQASFPTPNYANGVAYGNGQFVAVGDFGFIATSKDGRRWSQQESKLPKEWPLFNTTGFSQASRRFGFSLQSVAFGQDRWVAVGNDGYVVSSIDGIEWGATQLLIKEQLLGEAELFEEGYLFQEVHYADGRWIITGDFPGALISVNGRTWGVRSIDGLTGSSASAIGDGKWVVVGQSGKVFSSSSDRAGWVAAGDIGRSVFRIHFAEGRWVAVGDAVYTSTDLATWTKAWDPPLDPDGTRGTLRTVHHANGLWVAAGQAGESVSGRLFATSPDGLRWTQPLVAPGLDFLLTDLAYGNGRWIASSLANMQWSDDGLHWQGPGGATPQKMPYLFNLRHHAGTWIAGGRDGVFLRSIDGHHWTSHQLDQSAQPNWINTVFYSTLLSKWFLGGDFGKLWSSPDAATWTEVPNDVRGFEGLAEGKGMLVAVGRGMEIFTSTDGEAWQARPHLFGGEARLWDVAFGDGTFAAVADGGVVLHSNDGINWSRSETGALGQLESIAWDDGLWVVAGETEIFYSSDLSTWTAAVVSEGGPTLGGAPFLTHVSKHDSTWIATGRPGRIYISTDAKTWKRQPDLLINSPNSAINDIELVNGHWYAVGQRPTQGALILHAGPAIPIAPNRDLLFTDPGSHTVKETNIPVQFEAVQMPEQLGAFGETLYLACRIKRETPSAESHFTNFQLSTSPSNFPNAFDLGFGNYEPNRFGWFSQSHANFETGTPVILDTETHILFVRIDYSEGKASMVVDPTSILDLAVAPSHSTPTFPFSSILFRATGVTCTYSRMAVGEDPASVLAFASADPDTPALSTKLVTGGVEIRWNKAATPYVLESSRDLIDFNQVRLGILEESDGFLYRSPLGGHDQFFFRLRKSP